MATQQVIFVRGRTNKDYPWRYFHFHPTQEVDPGPVQLVYFDYPEGKRKTWSNWVPKRGAAPARPHDDEVDLQPTIFFHEDDGVLSQVKKPSILALYDYVKAQPPASVLSLQFFSHGDWNGPVLWSESYEFSEHPDFDGNPNRERDANDTEPRVRDFFGRNPLSGPNGGDFARAFTAQPLVKLWGCNGNDSMLKLVHDYQRAPRGEKGEKERRILLRSYLNALLDTYAVNLAFTLGRTVWAVPLGWSSRANPPPHRPYKPTFPPDLSRQRWWSLPGFLAADRKFYQVVLGAPLDKTGFVGYQVEWFDHVNRNLRAPDIRSGLTSPQELQQRLLDRIEELAGGAGLA